LKSYFLFVLTATCKQVFLWSLRSVYIHGADAVSFPAGCS